MSWDVPLSSSYVKQKDTSMAAQTEHPYKGAIIRQVPHTGLHENADTYGFQTSHVYQVVDEFDELAMPELVHQTFWSPYDAAMAWDHYCAFAPMIKARKGKNWQAHMAADFNGMLAMRRKMPRVLETLYDLEVKADEARDFGEHMMPEAVLTAINALKSLRYYG